jgi:hypothetical protein
MPPAYEVRRKRAARRGRAALFMPKLDGPSEQRQSLAVELVDDFTELA